MTIRPEARILVISVRLIRFTVPFLVAKKRKGVVASLALRIVEIDSFGWRLIKFTRGEPFAVRENSGIS